MASLFLFVFTVFFGAQYAITGFGYNLQPIFQMFAGYMLPGRPLDLSNPTPTPYSLTWKASFVPILATWTTAPTTLWADRLLI
ncbi:Fc.00g081220.m01.CDS01 [Cosmosporella sp. VM-42]